MIKKKNRFILSVIIATQSMQGCILDDIAHAITHLWSDVTQSNIAHSLSQAVTDGECWIRNNPQDAAILMISATLMAFLMVHGNTKRNTSAETGEFFTGFEQGQVAAHNESDIYLTLQQEAYRQGWHDAIAYSERIYDQTSQQDETDLDLIELEKAFYELAKFLKGESVNEISMHIKNDDMDIEVIVQK